VRHSPTSLIGDKVRVESLVSQASNLVAWV